MTPAQWWLDAKQMDRDYADRFGKSIPCRRLYKNRKTAKPQWVQLTFWKERPYLFARYHVSSCWSQ